MSVRTLSIAAFAASLLTVGTVWAQDTGNAGDAQGVGNEQPERPRTGLREDGGGSTGDTGNVGSSSGGDLGNQSSRRNTGNESPGRPRAGAQQVDPPAHDPYGPTGNQDDGFGDDRLGNQGAERRSVGGTGIRPGDDDLGNSGDARLLTDLDGFDFRTHPSGDDRPRPSIFTIRSYTDLLAYAIDTPDYGEYWCGMSQITVRSDGDLGVEAFDDYGNVLAAGRCGDCQVYFVPAGIRVNLRLSNHGFWPVTASVEVE